MNGREFLKRSHLPKPLHCPFSSSERLVGVFRPIVQPAACLLALSIADRSQRCPVRAKLVGHDCFRLAVSFHGFAQKRQRCLAIAALGNIGFEDFAFMVDGAPKIVDGAVDADIQSSGPGGLHPQALTDPDVSVSTHPAPTVQPLPDTAIANVQKVLAPDALRSEPSTAHADDVLSGVDISTSPSVPGAGRDASMLGKVPIYGNDHSR